MAQQTKVHVCEHGGGIPKYQADETLEPNAYHSSKYLAENTPELATEEEAATNDPAVEPPVNIPPSLNEFAPTAVPPSPGHAALSPGEEFFKVKAQCLYMYKAHSKLTTPARGTYQLTPVV